MHGHGCWTGWCGGLVECVHEQAGLAGDGIHEINRLHPLLLAQVHTSHERDEAIWVREQILTLRDQHNVKYQDIAVLYRTNLQVRVEEGRYVTLSAVSTRKPGIQFGGPP